jgi:hypothetical protein
VICRCVHQQFGNPKSTKFLNHKHPLQYCCVLGTWARMARGDHGLPKVSPGLPCPTLLCPAGGPPLKNGCKAGSLRPSSTPLHTPHAVRLWLCLGMSCNRSFNCNRPNDLFFLHRHTAWGVQRGRRRLQVACLPCRWMTPVGERPLKRPQGRFRGGSRLQDVEG